MMATAVAMALDDTAAIVIVLDDAFTVAMARDDIVAVVIVPG